MKRSAFALVTEARARAFYSSRVELAPRPKTGFGGWLERRDNAAVVRLLRPTTGLAALDAGCGHGVHARLLKQAGMSVCAIDVVPSVVDFVRPIVDEALVANLSSLALGRTFDRVLCFGVLEYVRDPFACIANLARHVAIGGRLVVQVPARSIGGRMYRWFYERLFGIRVGLFGADQLDAIVAVHGLRADGRERTFLHNMVLAWERPG
jgi:2-polyprenyl-3-methyl-5-hydroxy-6-metoxy-1,4-benzoquinol methylase